MTDRTKTILAALEKLDAEMNGHYQSLLNAFSFRAPAKEAEAFTISGLAIEYNRKDAYNQITAPGCLQEWLQVTRRLPLLFDHHGHLKAGEVHTFTDTQKGLVVEATVDLNTPVGRDVRRLVEAGVVDSLSAHIIFKKADSKPDPDFGTLRLKSIHDLGEISVVLFPAAPGALLTTARKTERETTRNQYLDRLLNVYHVDRKLEVPEIKKIVFDAIAELQK